MLNRNLEEIERWDARMPRKRLTVNATLSACEIETSKWPLVLIDNIPGTRRELFTRRKEAVDMYIEGLSAEDIKRSTGLSDDEVRRLFNRCVEVDEFGQTFGYRALIPFSRVRTYKRSRPVKINQQGGMSGVFGQLLDKHPELRELILTIYLDRRKGRARSRITRVKDIHRRFLSECRVLGITPDEYPFTSNDGGLNSLRRFCKRLDSLFFSEAAERHGIEAKRAASLVAAGFSSPNSSIIRPFERVQFDGHRIDAIWVIKLRTPEGDYITRTLHRIWLLTVIDVATGAVLGYHLSLSAEYTGADVLRCIRKSIYPHEKVKFTIPGLQYPTFSGGDEPSIEGGFPSDFLREVHWAKFDEISMDNGKANLSNVVLERLERGLKCNIGPGPVGAPERRGLIERFFGILEEYGFHRLVSTTGSNPRDPRRQNPEASARKYEMTFEHLQELTEVLISQWNLSPRSRVNYLTPIEAMRQRIRERGMIPRVIDQEQQEELIFMTTTITRKVCGNTSKGRRPYINYMGGEYRSPLLDQSAYLIGQKLTLQVNLDDMRVVKAFLPSGREFGNLVVQGKWNLVPHSHEIRSAIIKLKNKGLIHYGQFDDPIEIYHQFLQQAAPSQKNARNRLKQLEDAVKKQEDQQVANALEQGPVTSVSPMSPWNSTTGTEQHRDPKERRFARTLNR